MSPRVLRPVVAALMTVMLAATAACARDVDRSTTYVYEPDDSPIEVDTASLRAQKAEAGIAACPVSAAVASARVDALPDITLPCLGGGREVSLAGLAGTPTVINFWAQSCGPCRKESPAFQQVYAAAGTEAAVIGIDFQDTRPDWALAFADELGLTYPQLADPEGATKGPLQIAGLPITLFVDASGAIAYVEKGAVDSVAELTGLISEHLGVDIAVGASP